MFSQRACQHFLGIKKKKKKKNLPAKLRYVPDFFSIMDFGNVCYYTVFQLQLNSKDHVAGIPIQEISR